MKIFETLADLAACVGQEVAVSDWVTITQEQVNRFAEATGDHQWIHVDVERAKQGPFGAPIGVWVGVRIAHRINPVLFYRLVYLGMFLTGCKLVWDAWR